MKKLSFLLIFPIILFNESVFGETNLVGTWVVDADCLEIGNNSDPNLPGMISHENSMLAITWQQQGLYKGYICNLEIPNGILFGTINKNKVTFTQWDAIVEGKLQGNNTINIVSQHALMNPPSAPGTCIGSITRISTTVDCLPGPVITWP